MSKQIGQSVNSAMRHRAGRTEHGRSRLPVPLLAPVMTTTLLNPWMKFCFLHSTF